MSSRIYMWALRCCFSGSALLCLMFGFSSVQAQTQEINRDHPPKSMVATRTSVAPKIDGNLDDPAWKGVAVATDFIQVEPINGAPPYQRSEIRVLYDDRAIYIGAMLYDHAPDSILTQLSNRDVGGQANADYFQVGFDTYDDDQNAFVFSVSAAGVQTDSRVSQLGEDVVWDAVWKSEVKIVENGWIVEYEIPYMAVRFPKKEVQRWGMQFRRIIRRRRESSTWNFVDRAVEGAVNQFGALEDLRDIQPPVRLSLTPYISAYVDRYSPGNSGGTAQNSRFFNAGADLKYGLTESFTLDMTLVPDFGQVVSDNQVLNLSPFEVRFQENRPFFTEATELFNIAGIFYSRRIGGVPRNIYSVTDSLAENESIAENPTKTNLLNAFKISGRTSKKLGLGVFNGITGNANATVTTPEGDSRDVLTQPFTNYNVLVADQSFKNNSYLSLINTNLLEARGYMANVTASRFRLADRTNTWFVEGSGVLSQKWADIRDGAPSLGHAYYYRMGKASGNFVFDVGENVESHTYDPRDMGFLFANNEFTNYGNIAYNIYKPVGPFRGIFNRAEFNTTSLYQPRRFSSFSMNYNTFFQLKSFDFTGFWLWTTPTESYDFFEPRVPGRVLNNPWQWGWGMFLSTNYARRLAFDINLDFGWTPDIEGTSRSVRVSPRFRVNDKLQLIHSANISQRQNDR
ncbi:MAG: DUF5916 domain-containing protein, partial [Bacteroidota bacterium]